MAFTDRVLTGLGETFRDRAGTLLDEVVGGLVGELQATDNLVTPTARGWATVFDLDLTPAPAWLGHAFGAQVPGGLTLDEQRAYVHGRTEWRRGSCLAMVSAVQALLAGDKLVQLVERVDTAWRLSIRVLDSEATGVTDEQVLAAALTQKPVGLILVDVERWSAQDGIANWFRQPGRAVRYARMAAITPTYTESSAMFATYADMRAYTQEI